MSVAAVARAQTPSLSTSSPAGMGTPVDAGKGPWVLGEVLLFSGPALQADPALRDRLRAKRGILYTSADLRSDLEALKGVGRFESIDAQLYELPGTPVPVEFQSISISTSQVRAVFKVAEKAAPAPPSAAPKAAVPPAAISGVIFTPTAYRGAGRYATPGLGLDFQAAYFIGRLYGKNNFPNSVRKTSYVDRLGVWSLTADGKMQIQSESKWRPAMAVGAQGGLLFRDSPQPTITTPSVAVKVDQKATRLLSDAYVVASKNIYGIRTSAGYMMGSFGDIVGHLSEYLSPQSLEFYANRKGGRSFSRAMPFASLIYLHKPEYPLAVEYIQFNGAALNPWLLNFKLGYFFKLNFDVAILKFQNGYDVLGTFQFRYNHFPKR